MPREQTDPILELSGFATTLADEARVISMRYFRKGFEIESKSDQSPVTLIDREIETHLGDRIANRYPEHGFFGEEFGSHGEDRHFLWVVDPIDGTRSFISGNPLFGTLIALLKEGQPLLGIIDMPALDQRWLGVENQGTTLNGVACRTRRSHSLGEASLHSTSPDMFSSDQKRRIAPLVERSRFNQYGGDCFIYGQVASGWTDLVLEADLKPYDYCALVPVVRGAGGVISDWQGDDLSLGSRGEVVASATPALHQAALSQLTLEQ